MANVKDSSSIELKFRNGQPKDKLDLMFEIPGHVLRWLGPRQMEEQSGRIWRVLHKDKLSSASQREIEDRHYNVFRDGNTIRRGELVLGYAPKEQYDRVKQELAQASSQQVKALEHGPGLDKHNIKVDKREFELKRHGSADFGD
jgi:hypothetical protein